MKIAIFFIFCASLTLAGCSSERCGEVYKLQSGEFDASSKRIVYGSGGTNNAANSRTNNGTNNSMNNATNSVQEPVVYASNDHQISIDSDAGSAVLKFVLPDGRTAEIRYAETARETEFVE